MKDDTIGRQAAIDEFYIATCDVDKVAWAESVLKRVPTAEPQIIHCKDCQYWDKYSDYATLGTCGIWRTNRTRNDYCSEARCKDGKANGSHKGQRHRRHAERAG